MAEILFRFANVLVLPAWLLLIVAPRWKWTATLVAPVVLPLLLGFMYTSLVALNLESLSNGFSRLEDVARVLDNPYFLLAGWVHYLAFDLFIGAWEVRDAARLGIRHMLVIPCLVLTFLLGPVGLVCYFMLRVWLTHRWTIGEPANA